MKTQEKGLRSSNDQLVTIALVAPVKKLLTYKMHSFASTVEADFLIKDQYCVK